ncbi:hypothetical protein A3K81_03305 [Candidatus Bathyarchaeota archaeon RBG_13_60_20]|nr:MAG: hypothetical protein A3K81_03305 [Candidatus Bathyarchaeota archaeon RBG_13_60_20]
MRNAKNIFEPKASRILRCLLTNPGEAWSVRRIADEAQVSVGFTHAVTVSLLEQGYAARNEGNSIELVNPIKLLERWASYHQYLHENRFEDYYTFEKSIEKSMEWLGKVSSRYALTTLSGAYLVSPYVRPAVVEMYVGDEDQKESIVKNLDLRPTASEGNVRLVHPYDEGVFYKAQDIDGVMIVSDVQLYVDLVNYPSRGEEAARSILEKIKGAWSASLLGGQ